MLFCDVFLFSVKLGVPSDEDLEWLSQKVENWKTLGRRLKIGKVKLMMIDDENTEFIEKIYKMLLHWKKRNGSTATYTILHYALCHTMVNHTDLAEQLITGNRSLILQLNKITMTYKNSA